MALKKSKNTIAKEMYDGWEFEELSGGQKAAVTKRYDKQTEAPAPTRRARSAPVRRATPSSSALRVEVGRIGNGPMKAFAVTEGTTVRELLSKAGLTLDTKKEGVLAQTTGKAVHLDDSVKAGEVYVIAPEIESAY